MPFIDHLKSASNRFKRESFFRKTTLTEPLKQLPLLLVKDLPRSSFVGDPEQLNRDAKRLGVSFEGIEIINPATYERMDELCAYFAKRREKKGHDR